jgi:hypothetical protein
MREEILEKIKTALANPREGRNSMGCAERFYDSHYMVGSCFTEEELSGFSEQELKNLVKLADFASEVFY